MTIRCVFGRYLLPSESVVALDVFGRYLLPSESVVALDVFGRYLLPSESVVALDVFSRFVRPCTIITTVGCFWLFLRPKCALFAQLTATEKNITSHTDAMTLTVTLTDVNDNSPVFNATEYPVNVYENAADGADVVTVKATDLDFTDQFGTASIRLG